MKTRQRNCDVHSMASFSAFRYALYHFIIILPFPYSRDKITKNQRFHVCMRLHIPYIMEISSFPTIANFTTSCRTRFGYCCCYTPRYTRLNTNRAAWARKGTPCEESSRGTFVSCTDLKVLSLWYYTVFCMCYQKTNSFLIQKTKNYSKKLQRIKIVQMIILFWERLVLFCIILMLIKMNFVPVDLLCLQNASRNVLILKLMEPPRPLCQNHRFDVLKTWIISIVFPTKH